MAHFGIMDLIDAYTHCPVCGSAAFEKMPQNTRACVDCGYHYFNNPISAVAALICDDAGRLLLIRRAKAPSQGKLAFPGGFVDAGESLEAAVTREVAEEIGLTLKRLSYLSSAPNAYHYGGLTCPVCDVFFLAEVEDFDVVLQQEEVAGWCQVEASELDPAELAFDSMRAALRTYLARSSADL